MQYLALFTRCRDFFDMPHDTMIWVWTSASTNMRMHGVNTWASDSDWQTHRRTTTDDKPLLLHVKYTTKPTQQWVIILIKLQKTPCTVMHSDILRFWRAKLELWTLCTTGWCPVWRFLDSLFVVKCHSQHDSTLVQKTPEIFTFSSSNFYWEKVAEKCDKIQRN